MGGLKTFAGIPTNTFIREPSKSQRRARLLAVPPTLAAHRQRHREVGEPQRIVHAGSAGSGAMKAVCPTSPGWFCVLAPNVKLQGSGGVECCLVAHQRATCVFTPNKRRPLVLERRLRCESTSRTCSHLQLDESANSMVRFHTGTMSNE